MASILICSFPGCDKPHEARDWCRAHYRRWQRSGSPEFLEPDPKPQCAAEGCGRPSAKRGFCDAHYRRFLKYGDPLGGHTVRGEPLRFFLSEVRGFSGDNCLIWPYAIGSHGYGTLTYEGRMQCVHRIACEAANGPAPSPSHDAAHKCGVRACCNPTHLRWATRSENMEDMVAHDTHNRGERQWDAKLTSEQVRQIRALKGTMSWRKLAEMFNVSVGAIRGVVHRKSWAWLE